MKKDNNEWKMSMKLLTRRPPHDTTAHAGQGCAGQGCLSTCSTCRTGMSPQHMQDRDVSAHAGQGCLSTCRTGMSQHMQDRDVSAPAGQGSNSSSSGNYVTQICTGLPFSGTHTHDNSQRAAKSRAVAKAAARRDVDCAFNYCPMIPLHQGRHSASATITVFEKPVRRRNKSLRVKRRVVNKLP